MNTLVKCRTGVYRGRKEDNGVSSFLGIRYALPPTGRNRWKTARVVPEMKPGNETITDALEYGNIPVQQLNPVTNYSSAGRELMKRCEYNAVIPDRTDEDCLFLNVWTYNEAEKDKPVLVWIYGGSFLQGNSGSPETCGSRLAAEYKDIVVVSINYRLGVLGSINLSGIDKSGEYSYSHNLAVSDQQLALKWIYENIESFGGNPDNITICGHSAGSNAVTHHLTSEISRKYFAKAIAQSSFMPGAGTTAYEDSRIIGDEFIRLSGAGSMEELLSLSAAELLNIQSELLRHDFGDIKSKLFSPVADGLILPKDGFRRLIEGDAADKQVIIGCSAGEMDTMFAGKSELAEIKAMILKRCKLISSAEMLEKIEHKMASQLIPHRSERERLIDVYNDINIRLPGLLTAKALSQKGSCYVYYFDWWFKDDTLRSPHGVINPLLFESALSGLLPESIGKNIRESWIQFMKTGNPNNASIPQWGPYTLDNPETMIIDCEWRSESHWKMTDEALMLPLFDEMSYL